MARLVEAVVIVGAPIVTLIDTQADLQAAIDAMPAGGILRLGPGVFTVPDGGLILSKPVNIEGSGVGSYDDADGTWLVAYEDAASQPVIVIRRSATMLGWVRLADFGVTSVINDPGALPKVYHAGSHGIHVYTSDPVSDGLSIPLENIILERLTIGACGDDGIHAEAYNGSESAINSMTVRNCKISNCAGDGIYMVAHVGCSILDNYIHRNQGRGIIAFQGGYSMRTNVVEGNCTDDTLDHYIDGQVVVYAVRPFIFTGNHIEEFASSDTSGGAPVQPVCRGLVIRGSVSGSNTPAWEPLNGYDGGGFAVEGNIFVQSTEVSDNLGVTPTLEPRAIYVDNSIQGFIRIGTNFFRNCNVPIEVAATTDYSPPGVSVEQQCVEIGGAYVAADGMQLPSSPTAQFRDLSTVSNRADLAGHMKFNSSLSAALVYTGAGWAMTNNAPRLSTVDRDALNWSAGDFVWNTTDNEIQCYTGTGTTWKTVCSMA